MMKLNNGKIFDSSNRLVGFIINDRFVQSYYDKSVSRQMSCDDIYKTGLSAMELEQVSEAIQNRKYGKHRY